MSERYEFIVEPMPPVPGENDPGRRVALLAKIAKGPQFRLKVRWAPVKAEAEQTTCSPIDRVGDK